MQEYEEDMLKSMAASVLYQIGEPDMPVVSRAAPWCLWPLPEGGKQKKGGEMGAWFGLEQGTNFSPG